MRKNKKQLVFLDDNLEALLNKGELIDNYYNIGQLFDSVTIVTLNTPIISSSNLVRVLGTNNVEQVNIVLSKVYFFLTLGYLPILLRFFVNRKLKDLDFTGVDLVRSYGSRIGALMGTLTSQKYNLPHIISLHENIDTDYRFKLNKNIIRYIYVNLFRSISRYSLKRANHTIIVYDSIKYYLLRIGMTNFSLIYNFIPRDFSDNSNSIKIKNNQIRLIWIGRLVPEKNPINIIGAIKDLRIFSLDIVGMGPIKSHLVDYVSTNNLEDRVKFIDSIPNKNVISTIKKYNLFVANIKFLGIPKTVIESMFAGVPIIINKPLFGNVVEYEDERVCLVNDTKEGYGQAFKEYIVSNDRFIKMAKKAYAYAESTFDFSKQREKYKSLVEGLLKEHVPHKVKI
jgi:glycosyltransferase involved in cell wall biosynthesis